MNILIPIACRRSSPPALKLEYAEHCWSYRNIVSNAEHLMWFWLFLWAGMPA